MASITHCCAAMLALRATSKCADAVGAGGLQTVSCRRYDRSTDAFVDVDRVSLGIEEE